MNEEETMTMDAELPDAMSGGTPDAELDAAFDEGWNDDGQNWPGTSDADSSEAEEDDADTDVDDGSGSDQSGDDTGDGSEETPAAEETAAEGDEGESQDQTFTLKHLGEDHEVDRDEVIRLAQQGLDYPRIREKWDGVKDKVADWKMQEAFLQELADSMGGDINRLIDETRARVLMERAEADGRKLSAVEAARQAMQMRLKAAPETTGQAEAKQAEAGAKDGQGGLGNDAIGRFLELYGKDAPDSKDIPQSVWDEAVRTGDLIGPYQKWMIANLQKENKRLAEESRRDAVNRKNAERSAGSVRSAGAGAAKDPFDEGWDSAEF